MTDLHFTDSIINQSQIKSRSAQFLKII